MPKLMGNFTYPKITTPTDSLIAVDMSKDTIEGQIAACVLQGIVNRQSSKKIYVMNTYCNDNRGNWNDMPTGSRQVWMAERWLNEIFTDLGIERVDIDDETRNPGLNALLKRFHSFIKGMIIFDPQLEAATIEAATTIAGQTDGIVVSPALAEEIEHYRFPVIIDLRENGFKSNIECLRWLKANYFEDANKDVAFTWSHMTTGKDSWGAANKDYVVANRLFTFYLDITNDEEQTHYKDILMEYPMGTPVMGWADERWADALFASLGYFMVPYISVENLTVMSSFPSVTLKKQKPKPYPLDSNGVYIAFHVADGDNLEHSLVYEPNTILSSAELGKIPTTWVINPALADLAPRVLSWYAEKLKDQELAAMLGDGHPSSDRYTGFALYCEIVRHYMNRAGILTMKQMAESEAVVWNIKPYACISGYAGADPRGIGCYEYHMDGDAFHIGSVSFAKHDIKEIIDSAPADQPLFLSIFSGTAAHDVCSEISKTAKELEEKVKNRKLYFVLTRDMAATYRAWKGVPI